MVTVTSQAVSAESQSLTPRLRAEWDYKCSYFDERPDTEVWKEFKSTWLKSPIIHEILECSDQVNNEWKYWRTNNRVYDHIESLEGIWNQFKEFWDLSKTQHVFDEMRYLSDGMLWEWRYMYNDRYPNVYGFDIQPKAILWQNFKTIWKIDVSNYNEDEYNKMVNDMDLKEHFVGWEPFKNANYAAFDALSVREQYEIWKEFARHQCIKVEPN
ncbi:hypothetical protein HDV01_005870 [Terramyces sp. JEL0728]|nr:hypothetical protein HDV01_005870 [Terramyces sp. JEL0728]